MMQRIFARNILFLIFVNLVIKPIWIFGIDRNVQLHIGNEGYGLYFALFNFSIMFQILMDLGMLYYSTNKISRNPQNIKNYLPNIITAKFLLTILYLIIVIAIGYIVGYRGAALWLLLLLGVLQAVNSMMLYLRSNVAAMQFFTKDSILSVVDRLFVIVSCGVLLLTPTMLSYLTIEMFVFLQIIGMLITCIAAYLFTTGRQIIRWNLDFKMVLGIIKQSIPYAVLVFFMGVYMRVDAIILELANGSFEVGEYAKAYRLMDIANSISGVLFASILLPLFGRMIQNKERVQPIVSLCLYILMSVAITAIIAVWYWGADIMRLLYHSEEETSLQQQKILFALSIAYCFYSLNYIYGTLLTADRNIKQLTITAIAGVVINIIGCIIVAEKYGALGIAIVSAITIASVALINIFVSHNKSSLQLSVHFRAVWKMVFFAIIVFFCGYLINQWNGNIWLQMLLFSLSSLVAIGAMGIIPIKKLSVLLQKEKQ